MREPERRDDRAQVAQRLVGEDDRPALGSMPQIASTIAACSASLGIVLNIAGTNSAKKPRKSVCAASR